MDQKGLLHEPPETPARITQSAACRQRDPEPTKPLTGRSPNLKPRLPFRQQAPAASEYRPLVLPGFPERPRPDPCAPPRLSRRRQRALPRPRRPRRSPLSLLLLFEKASPTQKPCGYEALEIKELSHRLDGVLWPMETTGRLAGRPHHQPRLAPSAPLPLTPTTCDTNQSNRILLLGLLLVVMLASGGAELVSLGPTRSPSPPNCWRQAPPAPH